MTLWPNLTPAGRKGQFNARWHKMAQAFDEADPDAQFTIIELIDAVIDGETFLNLNPEGLVE